MSNTLENVTPVQSKITQLHAESYPHDSVPVQNHDIINLNNMNEDDNMNNDNYTKTEIDLKLENINTNTKNEFEKIDLKLSNIEQNFYSKFEIFGKEIKNILLEQERNYLKEQSENRKEFMYWFIGVLITLILGITTIIVTIVTTK